MQCVLAVRANARIVMELAPYSTHRVRIRIIMVEQILMEALPIVIGALLQVEVVRQSVNIAVVEVDAVHVMVLVTNIIHTVIMKILVHPVMEVDVALTAEELADKDKLPYEYYRSLWHRQYHP